MVRSALPPNAAYRGTAFSESYTYLNYCLARRAGDQQIRGVADLSGKVLGCINDPGASVVTATTVSRKPTRI